MRIVCPACAAAYQVPDVRLAPGRVVRCARCETDWTPIAAPPAPVAATLEPTLEERAELAKRPAPVPTSLPEPAPLPVVVDVEPAPEPPVVDIEPVPARRRRSVAVTLAWLASVAVLAGLGWEAWAARGAIMAAWPPSVRAYALLGVTPPAPSPP